MALKSSAEASALSLESSELDDGAQSLKPVLLGAIRDVLDELETVYDNVSKSAKDHIHSE